MNFTDKFTIPSYSLKETILKRKDGTLFSFPKPTLDSGSLLVYSLVTPSSFDVTVDSSGTNVVFKMTNSSYLEDTYILVMKAHFNSTLYTTITKHFTVNCPYACEYCFDMDTCEVCKDAYYYECEDLTDKSFSDGCKWVIFMSLLILSLSGLYNAKVNMDVWGLVNAI